MAQDRKEGELEKPELQAEASDHEKNQKTVPTQIMKLVGSKREKKDDGDKWHIATMEKGLILGVYTVASNEHDRQGLKLLMEGLSVAERQRVLADQGDPSEKNALFLEDMGSESFVMEKGDRNKPLTKPLKERNKTINKERWVIEQTFGSLARWFQCQVTRLKGLEKIPNQHVLESMAYHLKRSPGMLTLMPI